MQSTIYQNVADIRKDFSAVMDKAVYERPQFIERTTDHLVLLGGSILDMAFSNAVLHVNLEQDDDGLYIAGNAEIDDIFATGNSPEEAIDELAKDIFGYAQDYYQEFARYVHSRNRKAHLPYVLHALSLGSTERVKEMLICPDGKS